MTALQATSSSSQTVQPSVKIQRSQHVERHERSYEGRRFVPYKHSVLKDKKPLKSVEGEYKYKRTRELNDYNELLGSTFTAYCENLKTRREVTVLDSGAGQGIAMQDLIKKTNSIAKCTCITKHRFEDIDRPAIAKEKMKWAFARSEDYLKESKERFDLITDLFGAYAYSPDRDELIEHYYNHLKVGGKAFVFINSHTYLKNLIKFGEEFVRLEESLAEQYPRCFEILGNFSVLVITRVDESDIDLHLRRTKVIWKDNYTQDTHSKNEKHALDILYPQEVHFEVKE